MACAVAFGLVLVVLGLATYDLLRIRNEVDAGRQALSDLRLEDVQASGGIEQLAADVRGHLTSAADRAASSPWLRVLSPLPVVDDQLSALRDLTGSLAQLGELASDAGTAIDDALEGAGTPQGRLDVLDVALTQLARIEDGLLALDTTAPDGLLPPLRDAYTSLEEAVDSGEEKIGDGRELIRAALSVLAGPTRYLVLAGNNAEMTAGSGMPLSVGVAEISGGEIRLGEFVQASDVVLPLDRWVDVPGDLGLLYGLMGIGGDFRGTTATPNFPVTAPIFQEMAARTRLGPVDGVLLIDAVALGDLIELTGPITVEGTEYSKDNLVEELLNGNYKRFAEIDPAVREQRAGLQAQIAESIFDALTTREIPLVDFVDRLAELAEGRRLLAWSGRPEVQELWEAVGATGELLPNGLLISFQNYDGNKLDWYLRPEAEIDVGITTTGDWRVRLDLSVKNPELDPAEVGEVVLGPTPEVHFVLLDVHLPEYAYDIITTAEGGFRSRGADPPMLARTMLFPVRQGETVERHIEFSLPRDRLGMVLLPSARVAPLTVEIDDIATIDDSKPTFFLWAAAAPPEPDDRAPTAVRWLVVVAGVALLLAAAAVAKLARDPEASTAARDVAVAEVAALGTFGILFVAAALAIFVG